MTQAVVELKTFADFKKAIGDKGFLFIDVHARSWCIPCVRLEPIFVKLAEEFEGQVKFLDVDIDVVSEVSEKYNIESVPTLILFKDGKEVDRLIGSYPKTEIRKWLKSKIESSNNKEDNIK